MVKNRLVVGGMVAALAAGALAYVGPAVHGARSVAIRPPDGQPLAFELNQGQTDPRVKFLARGSGYRAFVTADGLTLNDIGFTPLGANANAAVTGLAPLDGKVNYVRGTDPAQWLANVPTFGQARAQDVYPGIDVVYYGADGQLEYDFVVAPAANPAAIRVAVSGARGLTLNGAGDLVVDTAARPLVQRKPVAYQEIDGARRTVDASYVLGADHSFGLRLGAYDLGRPLVIDPVIAYSTYLGGSTGGLGDDEGDAIAVDAAGNAYVTGRTASTNFPATAGLDVTLGGTDDAFVTKLSPAGAVLWSTYLGGTGFEQGFGVAFDTAGSAVYVTGNTTSADFPSTGGFDTTLGGAQDAFLTKLAAATGALTWSTYVGGTGDESGSAVAADASGNAFVTGQTGSATSIASGTGYDASLNGPTDAFIVKVSPAGALSFGTYVGGDADDQGLGVKVDSTGNVYITGATASSTSFPLVSAFDSTLNGSQDAFVVSVTNAGALRYGSYLGGDGDESGYGVAVAGSNLFVTGFTSSGTGFPTVGGSDTFLGGTSDAFVTKISATPSIIWSTYLGGSADEAGFGIDVDASGAANVTGYTSSADFPLPGAVDATFAGTSEAFHTRLNGADSAVLSSTFLGGSGDDQGFGIAVNGNAIHITGFTNSASGFPLVAPADSTFGGISDGFVTKLTVDATPPTCMMTGIVAGPPKQQKVTVQDVGSGLATLRNFVLINAVVSYSFVPGTTSPVVVTAQKIDQSQPSRWSFEAVDREGNVKLCQ